MILRRERCSFFWPKGKRKITKTFQKLDTQQTLNHILETECHSGDQVIKWPLGSSVNYQNNPVQWHI